jgi:hypothetical protein
MIFGQHILEMELEIDRPVYFAGSNFPLALQMVALVIHALSLVMH